MEILSLPLRKCGLKFPQYCPNTDPKLVTSLAEVWIDKKRKKVFINIGITIAVIIFAAILGIVVGELLLDNLI